MKALFGVVLIAFVAQASAQNNPSLRCFECADCRSVNRETVALVECYGPSTVPTRQTNPATIGLTPPTPTTTGLPTTIQQTTTPATAGQENAFNEEVAESRNTQIFSCYTIQRDIGDRRLTSRGCALIHRTKDQTCRFQNQGEPPQSCDLCDDHECNVTDGVTKVFASISLIFAALFIALRLH